MKKYLLLFLLLIPLSASAYTDNSLLKADSDKVFVINNGFKHWIKNPAIFNSYGFDWGKIISVPQADLDKVSEMTLIKTSTSDKVYLLEGDFRKWIPTAAIFEGKGYKWADIRLINETDFNSYQIGGDITADPIKYSGSNVIISIDSLTSDFLCPITNKCPATTSTDGVSNLPIANISFYVNSIGFENVKLSKITFKQVGQYEDKDFYLKIEKINDMHYSIATSTNTTTFTFDPLYNLIGNSTNRISLISTFLESNKYFQFKIESVEMIGEITGLPVKYEISNPLTTATYVLRK